MFEKLNRREKRLGLFASAFILLLILHFAIVKPFFSRIHALRDAIQSQSILLAKYNRVMHHQDLIQKIYGDYIGRVQGEGTVQEEISKFLQEVDLLCQRSEVRIIDMKPLGAKEDAFFKKVRLEIEVDAQQTSLGKFLFELKTSQAMIQVDHVRITAGVRGEDLKCHFILSRIVA